MDAMREGIKIRLPTNIVYYHSPTIGAPPTPQTARRLPRHSLTTSTTSMQHHELRSEMTDLRQSHDDPLFTQEEDYIRDHEVILDYAGRRVTKTMYKGCIQSSTCCPVLWNIILDKLLYARLSAGGHIQAFADDLLLVVTAASVGELENAANLALYRWGRSFKLDFGPTKTKLIAFARKAKIARINMDRHRLSFVPEVILLGYMFDEKLNFWKHTQTSTHVVCTRDSHGEPILRTSVPFTSK
ncbi:unnamed protein product [Parnassius apollo]|uniref:(apollo) hypothetical protein n=1 Tax=Parnassius apollo TaxID=110799 RepID=A0A8S3YET2_PARAO|nr:unnamed protein product [Parnassius apollo]